MAYRRFPGSLMRYSLCCRLPHSLTLSATRPRRSTPILKSSGALGASQKIGRPAGVDAKWITECAKDLLASRGQSLVVAGYRQPVAVHLLAHALNAALGNIGKTVFFHETPESKEGTLAELVQALTGKQVETLIIIGGNPVYSAPANLDFAGALGRGNAVVVRLGYYDDETTRHCTWHLPAAHYLESWGDAQTGDGTLVPIQPLIAPLLGGLTEFEILARIAGAKVTSPYEIVRETFAGFVKGDAEAEWKKFLHDGFLANSNAKAVEVKLNEAALTQAIARLSKTSAPGKENLEVVFHRDYKLDDGRYNNNGWL